MNNVEQTREARQEHAEAIAKHGGITEACQKGALPQYLDTTAS